MSNEGDREEAGPQLSGQPGGRRHPQRGQGPLGRRQHSQGRQRGVGHQRVHRGRQGELWTGDLGFNS